ncbi:hypothetical protein H6P81_001786 [Aristolochia fimbriata]|uniref:ENTH domain-containing protein n=1 Tax=Aristolochia fimbriata TaxID=158543 RepID=A0AAV7FCF5_ARIFI|nr:hypothetical protein H6P81_001786 [Aristolochia fimbriata]
MGSSKIRKALGAVKDQTSIGLAKVGSSNSLSDLDVAIVKATRHEEAPAEERHIREILSLTCYSRAYVSACVNSLSRRLNKTRNWTVALKTLILIHRLLAEGDPAYEQEIFFATRRGTRLLNMSDFCDTSRSINAWDFSAFVRTFALYLDERLEYRMQNKNNNNHHRHHHHHNFNGTGAGRRCVLIAAVEEAEEEEQASAEEDEDEEEGGMRTTPSTPTKAATPPHRSVPVREMKTERIFVRVQNLLQLLERFLACRPTGGAKHNRVVIVALYPLVKESFRIYYDITEIMGILIDRFMEMEVSNCVKVYDIFSRIGKQFDELDGFYQWSKTVGIARSSEYPDVERITQKKLDIMDEFIRDKSALAQSRRLKTAAAQSKPEPAQDPQREAEEPPPEDMNGIKALPAPPEEQSGALREEEAKEGEEKDKQICCTSTTDLLINLQEGEMSFEEQGDKLALALFAGETTAASASGPAWEAFKDESSSSSAADWETALVQSASHLSRQRPSLGGGFDTLMLDGMYQQPPAPNHAAPSGSASSMAYPIVNTPTTTTTTHEPYLALPAPPPLVSGNAAVVGGDPFAASNVIPPPSYVQMSEMEKKQQLLVEEQLMWQQYARDGMHGHLPGAAAMGAPHHPHVHHPNYHQHHNMGAYAQQGYYMR